MRSAPRSSRCTRRCKPTTSRNGCRQDDAQGDAVDDRERGRGRAEGRGDGCGGPHGDGAEPDTAGGTPGQPAQAQVLGACRDRGQHGDPVRPFGEFAVSGDGPVDPSPSGPFPDEHGLAVGRAGHVGAEMPAAYGAGAFPLPPLQLPSERAEPRVGRQRHWRQSRLAWPHIPRSERQRLFLNGCSCMFASCPDPESSSLTLSWTWPCCGSGSAATGRRPSRIW
jgi:hypothetical protein